MRGLRSAARPTRRASRRGRSHGGWEGRADENKPLDQGRVARGQLHRHLRSQ